MGRMNGSADADETLIGRAGTGDKAAFARLVLRHQPRLVALVVRSVGDRSTAEDIVQEVFIRAWIHAPTWKTRSHGPSSYRAWLARVAVNLAIDGFRKQRRTAPLDEIAEPADTAPLAEAAIVADERAVRVRAAIAALPERQRLALSLTYDAELSNAEGAAAMEISVGAFELLLVRARRTLRESLRGE